MCEIYNLQVLYEQGLHTVHPVSSLRVCTVRVPYVFFPLKSGAAKMERLRKWTILQIVICARQELSLSLQLGTALMPTVFSEKICLPSCLQYLFYWRVFMTKWGITSTIYASSPSFVGTGTCLHASDVSRLVRTILKGGVVVQWSESLPLDRPSRVPPHSVRDGRSHC